MSDSSELAKSQPCVPPILYHGTALDIGELAYFLETGLRGRSATESPTHSGRPSVPGLIYLSQSFALWFAALASHERSKPLRVVFEIETEHLIKARLFPDEDFLDELLRKNHPSVLPPRFRTDEAAAKERKMLDPRAYPALWPESLVRYQSIAYGGTIESKWIRRILVLRRRDEIFEHYMDWANPINLESIPRLIGPHQAIQRHHFDGDPLGGELEAFLNAHADDIEAAQLRTDYEYANEIRPDAKNVLARGEEDWKPCL